MSNNAMSNETDLDWLARNVHVWPCGKHQPWCYAVTKIDGERTWASNVLSSSFPYSLVDKDQWLARRAELQNKPGWKDAPEWAWWLAKDSPDKDEESAWWWYADKPVAMKNTWQVSTEGRCWMASSCHCDLGDWRDTLERRPEQDEFEPFVSVEDSKEQDMKQDNGWFERGELPPVGTVCLYVVSDRLSAEVEITAHAKFGLCFVEVGKSGENYVSKTAELRRFRPVRTERDVLLSIIVEEMNRYDTDWKLADAILAAGFSLRAK